MVDHYTHTTFFKYNMAPVHLSALDNKMRGKHLLQLCIFVKIGSRNIQLGCLKNSVVNPPYSLNNSFQNPALPL